MGNTRAHEAIRQSHAVVKNGRPAFSAHHKRINRNTSNMGNKTNPNFQRQDQCMVNRNHPGIKPNNGNFMQLHHGSATNMGQIAAAKTEA